MPQISTLVPDGNISIESIEFRRASFPNGFTHVLKKDEKTLLRWEQSASPKDVCTASELFKINYKYRDGGIRAAILEVSAAPKRLQRGSKEAEEHA